MAEETTVCYAVKDWQKHFENSESRKYKSLTWVPVKNKHDGKGYRRVVAHPKSIQVFCAWILMIQVASKMPVRGILHDDDGPLTASDLADKTGLPKHIFEEAFKILPDSRIEWLVQKSPEQLRHVFEEAYRASEAKGSPDERVQWLMQRYSGVLRKSPETPEPAGMNGIEQNQNRMERNLYSTLKGERGAGKGEAEGGWQRAEGRGENGNGGVRGGSHLTPHTSHLSFGDIGRVAGEIMGNDWGWCYDNCRVKLTDFTLASLQTVLRPFVNRATERQVRDAWLAAVKEAHALCVDFGEGSRDEGRGSSRSGFEPVRSAAALATQKFRERMKAAMATTDSHE